MAHTKIPELKDYQRHRNDIEGRKHFKDALGRWHGYHERQRLERNKGKDTVTPPKSLPKPKEGYVGPVYNPDTWISKEPLTETRTVGSGRSKKDVTFYRIPGTNTWGGPDSVARSQQEAILFNKLPPSLRGDTIQETTALREQKKETTERKELPETLLYQADSSEKTESQLKYEEQKEKAKFEIPLSNFEKAGRRQSSSKGSVSRNKYLQKKARYDAAEGTGEEIMNDQPQTSPDGRQIIGWKMSNPPQPIYATTGDSINPIPELGDSPNLDPMGSSTWSKPGIWEEGILGDWNIPKYPTA